MSTEFILYRHPEEEVTEDQLRQFKITQNTDVVVNLPGQYRDVTLKPVEDTGLDQKIHIYCDEDNTYTRVTYRYQDAETGEAKETEALLSDSPIWFPIPAEHEEFSWVLVRHQNRPNHHIGQRYGSHPGNEEFDN